MSAHDKGETMAAKSGRFMRALGVVLAAMAALAGEARAQATAPIRVYFSTGESSKTLQLSRDDVTARAQFGAAPSQNSYWVCDVPDTAQALQRFITENPGATAEEMGARIRELYNNTNSENTAYVLGQLAGRFGSTSGPNQTRLFSTAVVPVSSGDWDTLAAGRGVSTTVKRRCLTGDQGRAWLREAARVLSLYYGVAPPQ